MMVLWPCSVWRSASRVAGFLAGSQISLNSFSSLGTRCLQTRRSRSDVLCMFGKLIQTPYLPTRAATVAGHTIPLQA